MAQGRALDHLYFDFTASWITLVFVVTFLLIVNKDYEVLTGKLYFSWRRTAVGIVLCALAWNHTVQTCYEFGFC
jgi:hypothetical protein